MFRRRPSPPPAPLALELPRLDDLRWPGGSGRPSFEASTYSEMAHRRAHDPDAHALADRLTAQVLPLLDIRASAEDEPYLHKTLLTAARLGVGLGLVERQATAATPGELDPSIAGAIGTARRTLPAVQEQQGDVAGWFLLAGHWLARQDDVEVALQALREAVT